jgi:hypothetical protein
MTMPTVKEPCDVPARLAEPRRQIANAATMPSLVILSLPGTGD